MNTVESKVERLFYEKDICINCTDRPWYNNPWGAKTTTHGIEVHKKDAENVIKELTRLGIQYNIHEGKFINVNGCWTHKAFKFLEIPNHKKAYAMLVGGSQ